jgi:hypothetical protein
MLMAMASLKRDGGGGRAIMLLRGGGEIISTNVSASWRG